jgi:nucleolar protein 14
LSSVICSLSFLSLYNIFQALKAQEKGEDQELVEDLDNKFTSLVHSKALLSLTEPNKMKALKALVNNNSISIEKSDKDSLSATRATNNFVQVPLFILEGSCPNNFLR